MYIAYSAEKTRLVVSKASPQSEWFCLQRNTDKCGHCGVKFSREEQIPFVNRSDGKTFHLRLCSKPDLRPISDAGFPPQHLICKFEYSHRQTEPEKRFVIVLMLTGKKHGAGVEEIEDAADKLAQVLKAGEKPKAAYLIDRCAELIGFPR
jgi:hypothetical protein